MKYQKICIIGDGLSGLVIATALADLNLNIDIYYQDSKISYKKDRRTTAISESNFRFLSKKINIKNQNLFWPCKNINLFYEKDQTFLNFLNFEEKSKNLMYIFKNSQFKNFLKKNLKKNRKINFLNKKVSDLNFSKNYVKTNNNKFFYDIILLCAGSKSKLYDRIKPGRSIFKNYNETAITTNIKHKFQINNPSQYFLKEGPFAILPIKENCFSLVWTVKKEFHINNLKKLKKIINYKLQKIFLTKKKFNIDKINSFPIYLNLEKKYFKRNTLIFGEGIHSVHPLAGQGFNLVIRDIKKLSELIEKNIKLGLSIKDSFILNDFFNQREPENTLFGLGIHFTNEFFKRYDMIEPVKFSILNNISKLKKVKNLREYISDKGFLT